MGHTLFFMLGFFTLIQVGYCEPTKGATLNLKPHFTTFLPKENVSLTCDIDGANELDWDFTFTKNGKQLQSCSSKRKSCLLKMERNSSGEYQCLGSDKTVTKKSNTVNITVSDRPALVVSSSRFSPGASVTLTCEPPGQSDEWRFFWSQAVSFGTNGLYSYELLPSNGKTTVSSINHRPDQTAVFACRVGRGVPLVKSEWSPPRPVWSEVPHPASPSIRVVPSSAQSFTSLQCEGNSSQWRVMRFTEGQHFSKCSKWGTMTGSTCRLTTGTQKPAQYWCETNSGLYSHPVTITIPLSKPEDSPFPLPLVVGLIFAILLFPSMLLLYQCLKPKNGKKSQDVAVIEPKSAENADYSLVYVQVCPQNKGKHQPPAAREETIYSEVKI